MTDYLARINERLNANREKREVKQAGEPKTCVQCGRVIGNPVYEDGTRGIKPLCWRCWE